MKFSILKWLLCMLDIKITKNSIQSLINVLDAVFSILVILIIAKIILKIFNSLIEKFFKGQKKSKFNINEKKADTLSELLKSIMKYVLYFIIVVFWIFPTIGFDRTTVISFTGVAGVALGFGAQSLVKDVISGFFILFEDQFSVGDYIEVDGVSGFVEAIGLRVTKLRDFTGDINIVPNGSITRVTNKSRGNMRALVDTAISNEENIDKAIGIIKKVCEEMKKDFKEIVEGPEVLGVTDISDAGIVIRVIAKTLPMKQWNIEMELRKRIIHAFEIKKVKMPYPKKIIFDYRKEGDNV
jgi:small-conductance mechanosensitive channel